TKPFCDDSHVARGFTDGRDPRRVPDKLDVHAGQQAYVFDNRGTCAHSGFCTDRLNSVFHLGEEPFIAPSGARLDDLINAVRRCPSGALGIGIGP
ncbi:(4Fe-4S)-binding protein, partial [Acinetobacter baumannii]